MPPYSVHEARTREEVDALAPIIFAAFHDPYIAEYQFLHPFYGHPAAAASDPVRASQERRWTSFQANKASHWIYVRDDADGKVVGATEWLFFKSNPFPAGPATKLEANWWPPGESRDFTESLIQQIYKPRMVFMQMPHAALNSMAVLPSLRKHGIGSRMMAWGIERIDEKGLEAFIEASSNGRALYERVGLRVVFTLAVDTYKPDAGDEWRACTSMLGPVSRYVMWRPVRGIWKEGMTGPWDRHLS